MTSTNLEPNEWGETAVYENKYIYKWTINNSLHPNFPADVALQHKRFVFYLNGIKYLGELKITGPYIDKKIMFSCTRNPYSAFYVKLSLADKNLTSFMYNGGSFTGSLDSVRGDVSILCEIQQLQSRDLEPFKNNIEIKKYSLDLFENKPYWDVTFLVAEHKIHGHKCILATRSKVFDAMFEHDMEETKLNTVTITDIDPEVFVEMLRFCYTDEVLNLNKMTSELLTASDKYDLQSLKCICESELAKNLSVENAAEILMLSDLHGANNLKDYILTFINCHKNSVLNTKGWKQIVNNHTDFTIELYQKI